MVKNMMEAGLPIGKDALLSMNKNLSAFPNSSISTMVEMKSLNIPITSNNIIQFESYKNYEHQVIGQISEFMDELPNTFNELVASGNTESAVKLYEAVLKEIAGNADDGGATVQAQAGEAGAAVQADSEQVTVSAQQANADAGEIVSQGKGIISEQGTVSDQGVVSGQAAELQQKGNVSEQELATKEPGAAITDQDKAAIEGSQARTELSPELRDSLKNLGVSEEAINKYVQTAGQEPGAAAKELLKELYNTSENGNLSDKAGTEALKDLFSHKEYNKILKDAISSDWLLKPDDVRDKENINHLYQRLNSQMKGLSQAIANTVGAESKLGQVTGNIQNNLDFINQLNQMFQYVQLPLRMAGQNVHGDLYVYRNKHKKMSEDGSVSAVLHLDMENLGPVDVYVKMITNKVTTNFYVADESVLDLINDNIHILNERLEKRGYTMQVKMMLHDEADEGDAAVDEMLNVSRNTLISTASFDARA